MRHGTEDSSDNNQKDQQPTRSLIERVENILDRQPTSTTEQQEQEKRDAMGAHARERLLICKKMRDEAAADSRLCRCCGYFECICNEPNLLNIAAGIVRSFVPRPGGVL